MHYLSPNGGQLLTSPHCEILHTIVVCDDSNEGDQLFMGRTDNVWLSGFENFRVLKIHNLVYLKLDSITTVLKPVVIGTLWMVYPWSCTTSSMMPIGQEKNNITQIIDELSKFLHKLKDNLHFPIQCLFELTTAVSLHETPPKWVSSYVDNIRIFGGPKGTTISIPFVGQYS